MDVGEGEVLVVGQLGRDSLHGAVGVADGIEKMHHFSDELVLQLEAAGHVRVLGVDCDSEILANPYSRVVATGKNHQFGVRSEVPELLVEYLEASEGVAEVGNQFLTGEDCEFEQRVGIVLHIV